VAEPIETAVRDWLTATLGPTGTGDLPGGAHLARVNSPETGGWAVVGLGGDSGTDGVLTRAVIDAAVYAGTWQVAEKAAQALVNLLDAQQGAPVPLPGGAWVLRVVDGRQGPTRAKDPDGNLPCYAVGADLYLTPAA
jgi:hypothetical protein